MTELRLILGDQLNASHSWYKEPVSPNTVYCLFEMRQETDYVKHHIQKIVGFFGAMRNFAQALQQKGHTVIYYRINDGNNTHHLLNNLKQAAQACQATQLAYQLPDEYRLQEQLNQAEAFLKLPVKAVESEHFLTSRSQLAQLFEGKKQILMETFYRDMRKRHGILMQGKEPLGGKWNYDHDNRNAWKGSPKPPKANTVENQVSDLVQEIKDSGCAWFGHIDATRFLWPLNRKQSLQLLKHFIEEGLPHFGSYQDAMHTDENWLFHSRLSFALNTKMLSPKEVIMAAEQAHLAHPEKISLAQAEGFIRQIAGWREYMRGIYWWKMPEYATLNYFGHKNPLPEWYWTGQTRMNCLKHAIQNSLDHAYAHHIQRLMITGNFALLAGIDPTPLDAWYLGIYMDAIEWVEITNTRGMSQFADGGIVGTKPYVSSANYIQKMSNYCQSCHYLPKEKVGDKACPFNSLYWRFYEINRPLLQKNPRIGMMYVTLNKMQAQEKEQILQQAEKYLSGINHL